MKWLQRPCLCTILLYMCPEKRKPGFEASRTPVEKPVEQTLLDAEALLGVCITVYDLTGVFHDNEGRSLLGPARESHRQRSVLCGLGFHGRRCKAHCRERVSRWVADHPEGIAHRCWKGLMEVAVPIRRQGVLLATLLAGQWREPEARDENVEGLFGAMARGVRRGARL